ncbi:MAG: hypothetical protein HY918_03725 [Candidatus Doudnabacteria bacterium]|nr:hypothetical protein [Candidatus Doudnabacteria bacterium]
MSKLKKAFVISFVIFGLLGSAGVLAQTAATTNLSLEEKTQLQKQLDEINSQIADIQQQLNDVKGQKNTLQNKVKQLQKQQAALNLQIQATTLQVASLQNQIVETQGSIDVNTQKINQLQQSIANYIRLINQRDGYPFLYVLVGRNNLSDAAGELENLSKVSSGLRSVLAQAKDLNNQLGLQKESLSQQEDQANNLLSIKGLQQQQVLASVSEQSTLLQQTKGREADYQITLNDTQKRANEIRSRLYQLLGVSTQITFGDAVKIAQWAEQQTGVRAAFLLAILTQESNLGKNVGTCNRPGDPPEKSWKVVMKPTRDQEPFLKITSELGLDPDTTPVSCPMKDSKGRQVGWGGAMGPAQFIPSTWMGYKDKVAAMTGKAANPWDIRDAFIASAIKLGADGATAQSGEWAAAMKYFSGSTNTKYRFYGDNVVAQAEKYQNDINDLNK